MNRIKWSLLILTGLVLFLFMRLEHPKINLKTSGINNISIPVVVKKASAPISPSVKTKVTSADPFLDCSDQNYVCEKAILYPENKVTYSNYIWADEGEPIKFGGQSPGGTISVWIESDDRSFNSAVDIISSKDNLTFTIFAPFNGNFRIVVQNNHDKTSETGEFFIKDSWD